MDRLTTASRTRWRTAAALAGVALLAWIGVVAYVLLTRESAPPERAPLLRANVLPDGLAGAPAPRIVLDDARSERVDTAGLRGRPYAVTFLYTRCGDVCPLIGQELRGALSALGPAAGRTAVLAVTVDPDGDTPAATRAWLRRHRMPPNFHYLVGSTGRLEPVWRAYFVSPQIPGRPESSTHTASIWLVDARGRRRGVYPGGQATAPEIAHDLRVLLDEAREPVAAPGGSGGAR